MKKNNWLVPGLIALGIALIIFSIWAPQNNFLSGYGKKKIAFLVEKTGDVKIHNNEMPLATIAKIKYQFLARDILKTEATSDALIELSNGGQFSLSENTEILFDQLDNGQTLIVLRTGEIFIEKFGKAPSFWVRKDGQMYSSVDYALIDKKNSSHLKEALPQQPNKEQITEQEIENTLNSKKNDFFKCFGQLIQKNPQASGQVLISFTIEKNGRGSNVEINKSEINEINFKTCLIEVVARTQFRAFNGSAVTTVFPLKFE